MRVTLGDGTGWDLEREVMSNRNGDPVTTYAACIIDGARGHGDELVCELAREHGWKGSVADLVDPVLYAEQYLNDQIDRTSYEGRLRQLTMGDVSFGWDAGDFYLANEAWWAMVADDA